MQMRRKRVASLFFSGLGRLIPFVLGTVASALRITNPTIQPSQGKPRDQRRARPLGDCSIDTYLEFVLDISKKSGHS
jgi:hypothetical protein